MLSGLGCEIITPLLDVLVKIDTSGLKGEMLLTKLSSLNDEDAIDDRGVEA